MSQVQIELPVSIRPQSCTKGQLKSARQNGQIPAVLYGGGTPENLWVSVKALNKVLHTAHSANALVSLIKEGKNGETALIKSIQRDFVLNHPIHADFLRVSIHQKVEVAVAVHAVGEAKGVKLHGGILEHLLREVKVRCTASDIPEAIVCDVSGLDIGSTVTAGDLSIPKGVELLTPANYTVFSVIAPKAAEEAVPAAVEAVVPAQPEVIGKGKKEEAQEGTTPAATSAKAEGASAKK